MGERARGQAADERVTMVTLVKVVMMMTPGMMSRPVFTPWLHRPAWPAVTWVAPVVAGLT